MNTPSPWLIVVLASVLLVGMWLMFKRGRFGWRMIALMSIPLSLVICYTWVGITDMQPVDARLLVRHGLLFSLAVSLYVVYSYLFAATDKRRHYD